jgi:hypothetical protein
LFEAVSDSGADSDLESNAPRYRREGTLMSRQCPNRSQMCIAPLASVFRSSLWRRPAAMPLRFRQSRHHRRHAVRIADADGESAAGTLLGVLTVDDGAGGARVG